jgi:putative ATP-grasp target RiPP
MSNPPASRKPVLPWGLRQVAPFTSADPLPYVRVELDPASQTTLRFAVDGTLVELGKHGTNREIRQPTQTPGPDGGDPKRPPPPDKDSVTAYVPD